MTRLHRWAVLMVATLALAGAGLRAQTAAGQKPRAASAESGARPGTQARPDAQARPVTDASPGSSAPVAPEDYPPDYKAFNEVAKETNPSKRVELYEKFVADNPKSSLVSMARSQIQSTLLAVIKDAQKKYQELAAGQVAAAKNPDSPTTMGYSTVNRLASDLLANGVLLEQAEEYARAGLSLMDERKYLDGRKPASSGAADAAGRRAEAGPPAPPAALAGGKPPSAASNPANAAGAATAAPAEAPARSEFTPSFSTREGVVTVRPVRRPAPTASATSRPPTSPPSEDDLRRQFRSEKASAQATLGQILMKRGKTEEAERVLKEAYAARPASYTMATIARLLSESAKKAGDDKAQLEYMTVLALSGRITTAERKDFEAVYRKTHGGALDGIEEMLDERYRRETPKLQVTPFARKPGPNRRAVLVEMFTGAG